MSQHDSLAEHITQLSDLLQSAGWSIIVSELRETRQDFLEALADPDNVIQEKFSKLGGRDYIRASVHAIDTVIGRPRVMLEELKRQWDARVAAEQDSPILTGIDESANIAY